MADTFTLTLTGDQEAPTPVATDASGTGAVVWDEATSTAAYTVTVEGLDFGPALGREAQTEDTADDVTVMHVHDAPRGVSGPVVFGQIGPAQDADDASFTLNADGSWTVSGSWEPTDPASVSIETFADALTGAAAGSDVALYFNVHSTTFPAGEIRGQWVAADGGPGPEPEPEPEPGGVDWNALAAVVQANFEATGQWFPGVDLPPEPVDWNAVAAAVTANFEATGQWFL